MATADLITGTMSITATWHMRIDYEGRANQTRIELCYHVVDFLLRYLVYVIDPTHFLLILHAFY